MLDSSAFGPLVDNIVHVGFSKKSLIVFQQFENDFCPLRNPTITEQTKMLHAILIIVNNFTGIVNYISDVIHHGVKSMFLTTLLQLVIIIYDFLRTFHC